MSSITSSIELLVNVKSNIISIFVTHYKIYLMEYITEYLHSYINTYNPQYAVMLKGKWGCGKTYYIKKLINEWGKNVQETNDKVSMKPIYVSLNGISSQAQISYQIRKKLHPILYSKGAQFAKNVIVGTFNVVTKGLADINNDGDSNDLNEIIKGNDIFDILLKPSDKIIGKKIIVFDDLERCCLNIEEVFGYINNLVEHAACNVIILCEEDVLLRNEENTEKTIKYKEFKEKLIGQTIAFKQDFNTVISEFTNEINNNYINENFNLIYELFLTSSIENLRSIRQCLFDFCRFVNNSKLDEKEFDKKNEFMKSLLAYFVIAYCEYKSGNDSIRYFHESHFLLDNKKKEQISAIERKYSNLLHKYDIINSIKIIRFEQLVSFIENGFIEQNLFASNEYVYKRKIDVWEELYFFMELDNSVFLEKLRDTKKVFFRSHIEYVSVVIHIFSMLLFFSNNNIVKLKDSFLKKRAKVLIDYIHKNFREEKNFRDRIFVEFHSASWGKQYYLINSPEVQDIIKYAKDKKAQYESKISSKYCISLWHNLNNQNFNKLYSYFEEDIPNGHCKYSSTAIFKDVNPHILAKNIISLSNKNKEEFYYYLISRYDVDIDKKTKSIYPSMIDDLSILQKLKNILEIKINNTKMIDKVQIKKIVSVLESLTKPDTI